MKKLSLLQLVYAGSFIFFIAFAGINARKITPAATRETMPVNPKFEQNPPAVGDISIKQISNNTEGNILFVADFGKSLEKETFHAVMVGDSKMILRDDGNNGDAKAGDGKFSGIMNEDLNELQKGLDGIVKTLQSDKDIIHFNGRTLTRQPTSKFDFSGFTNFKDKQFLILPRFRLPCGLAPVIKKENSLTITAASVVEDATRTFNPCTNTGNANGAWAFPKLITEMANTAVTGVTPSDFLKRWLESWKTDIILNGDTLKKRMEMNRILNTWSAASGGSFDIKFAPFKLIAIVNRVDLRGNSGYGFKNGGEVRFVFCAVGCTSTTGLFVHRFPNPFMLILEYGIPAKKCGTLKDYATGWADLSALTLGSASYKTALTNLTNQVTLANASPSKPNGSSLNQLRTNEFAFDIDPWELRQFTIDNSTHQLRNVLVDKEPQFRFNKQNPFNSTANVNILAAYVNANTAAIEANNYTLPDSLAGKPFAAARALTNNASNYHWNGATVAGAGFITSDSARFVLSLNTCSGCHGGEGKTGTFIHVTPNGTTGVPASLSGFIAGQPAMSSGSFIVTDRANRPSPPGQAREFNDLERRKLDLAKFVSCPCANKVKSLALAETLRMRPLNMTH
ncbi:MAG: choice-of-anchor X domain-containing protein [Chitinophagaceae bacterium]